MSSRHPPQPPGAFPEDSEFEDSVQVSISEKDSETGPVDPSMSRLQSKYNYERSLQREYPLSSCSTRVWLEEDYYYDGGTDGDEEDRQLESDKRKTQITDESQPLRTSRTSRTCYDLRTSGGGNSPVTIETILGDGSSAFGTEESEALRKSPPGSKTHPRYTRIQSR